MPARITRAIMIAPAMKWGFSHGESKRLMRFFLSGVAPGMASV